MDAALFEHLEQRANLMLANDPSDATTQLSSALDLWRGPAFGEMGDEPALQAEAGRLTELRSSYGTVRGSWPTSNHSWPRTPRTEVGGYTSAPHAAITPDGRRLLTSGDGALHRWTLDTDELLEIASGRTPRTLTPTECERYGIEDCPAG